MNNPNYALLTGFIRIPIVCNYGRNICEYVKLEDKTRSNDTHTKYRCPPLVVIVAIGSIHPNMFQTYLEEFRQYLYTIYSK